MYLYPGIKFKEPPYESNLDTVILDPEERKLLKACSILCVDIYDDPFKNEKIKKYKNCKFYKRLYPEKEDQFAPSPKFGLYTFKGISLKCCFL